MLQISPNICAPIHTNNFPLKKELYKRVIMVLGGWYKGNPWYMKAARAWSDNESLLWADRCRALVVLASVSSLLPSHCSHHWQPDAMCTVNNCCCFSPWLHKQHGGGMTLCFVCARGEFGWRLGTCVWQHVVVPGWVMTSHPGGESTSVYS